MSIPKLTRCRFKHCSAALLGFFVGLLCLLQGVFGIGCASARAQAVSQLRIQGVDKSGKAASQTEAATASEFNTRMFEGYSLLAESCINSSKLGADNTDYLAGDERYDWCAGYALYRYTLEVNGVKESQITQWERSLRRYCAAQAKSGDGIAANGEHGAEGKAYDGDWGAVLNIDFASQLQGWKFSFVDFQDHKVANTCQIIKWRGYLGGNGMRMPEYGYEDIFTGRQLVRISSNMQGSDDPSIWINNKAGSMHRLGINSDDRGFDFPTGFNLSKWLLQVLAIDCGTGKEQNEQTAQPHRATPSAGEAH